MYRQRTNVRQTRAIYDQFLNIGCVEDAEERANPYYELIQHCLKLILTEFDVFWVSRGDVTSSYHGSLQYRQTV